MLTAESVARLRGADARNDALDEALLVGCQRCVMSLEAEGQSHSSDLHQLQVEVHRQPHVVSLDVDHELVRGGRVADGWQGQIYDARRRSHAGARPNRLTFAVMAFFKQGATAGRSKTLRALFAAAAVPNTAAELLIASMSPC